MNDGFLLEAKQLSKSYQSTARRIDVLKDLDLQIPYGKTIAIMGASGVGKSTLLHVLGGLDRPDSGQILFEGRDLASSTPQELADFRNAKIGFVFQMHHLLPEFNALENVMMPILLRKFDRQAAGQRASKILQEVGLSDRMDHRPGQLSGGEQQRAAIARALVNDPPLILADEPTGNLDERTGETIFQLFRELHSHRSLSFIIATHNPALAAICDETYILHEGKLTIR
ncbi:MAG TPA: ABC transporter ATP-binding protein [Acidobacteriota bacterium]|nr:ABC transporter ATP-binding protein [Acidobacteriota bacterium]